MAKEVTITKEDLYAARIFFRSALPLLKVICENIPKIGDKFKGKNFVFQVSAKYESAEGGKMGTYFVVEDGVWTTFSGKLHESPTIEFEFSDLKKFILFFSGKGMPLPKIKGMTKIGLLVKILSGLLKMAALLQAADYPDDIETQKLLVKLYFYLLPNGISQLNKAGYPSVKKWTSISPDRAYAWAVNGEEDLQSWIRIKAGNSKSGRGAYPRCKPFITMRFDTPAHALDILMDKVDMMDYMRKGFLNIEGAPEFGAELGDHMLAVGDFAKGTYLDKQK